MKQKEYNDRWILWSFIVIIIFILISSALNQYQIDSIKQELKNVPHKYCWNETIYGEIYVTNTNNEIVNLTLESFGSKRLQCLRESYNCTEYFCMVRDVCKEVLDEKEVCEIR